MILFGNPLNVSVRKVRCGAALHGIGLEEVSVLKGSDDPIFRSASPAGVVPALRDGDLSLFGALPILEYFDLVAPARRLLPADARRRVSILSVAHLADGPLAQSMSIVFQNSVFLPRFLGKPGNMRLVKRVMQGALPKILGVTEAALARLDAEDEAIGLARLSVFAQCLCLPLSGQPLAAERYPMIAAAMAACLGHPGVRAAVTRDAGLVGSSIDAVAALACEGARPVLAAIA